MKTRSKIEQALRACKKAFGFVALFSLLVNLLMLTVPVYMLQIFDRVLSTKSGDTLIYLTLIAVIAIATLALLDIARSALVVQISHWLDRRLSSDALLLSPDEALHGQGYGAQALRDITSLRQFVGGPSVFAFLDAPWTPVYLFVIYMFHPMLGVLATIGAIILLVLALMNEKMTQAPLAMANMINMQNQKHVDGALRNAEVIQAMGMMPNVTERWSKGNSKVLDLQIKASSKSGMIVGISKFFRLSLQLGILGLGAYFVIQNKITPGAMIAASIITSRALAPIEQMIGAWKQMVSSREAYQRLKKYLQRPNLRQETTELPKPEGRVQIEGLTFMIPGVKDPILRGINFTVEPGKMLGIIGPSGAGKSTLARMMLGIFMPNMGAARLDGANAFTTDRKLFGPHVGYLPQDVELFPGTVAENIARMSGEVDDEKVVKAAKIAGAHDLILHMPGGYQSLVGGFKLSGGQRQRIALARAFYDDPSLIVLDEPNSSLDNEGDQALFSALKHAREHKQTVVLISHRPNLVGLVDNILVLQKGQMQLYGPRDDVLAKLKVPSPKEVR